MHLVVSEVLCSGAIGVGLLGSVQDRVLDESVRDDD